MKHSGSGKVTEFFWARNRLFDHQIATILFEMCVEAGTAIVTKVCFRLDCTCGLLAAGGPLPCQSCIVLDPECAQPSTVCNGEAMLRYPAVELDFTDFARSYVNSQDREGPTLSWYSQLVLACDEQISLPRLHSDATVQRASCTALQSLCS